MAKGNGYNRRKENYYEMTLYFSSSKKEEVSLYFFLKQLTQRRKATSFITKILTEYLRVCGYKDPMSVQYEDIEKLPDISELVEKSNKGSSDAAGFMNMLASMFNQSGAAPQESLQTNAMSSENAIRKEEHKVVETEPELELTKKADRDEIETQDSKESEIDSSWMQGLSSFMEGQ